MFHIEEKGFVISSDVKLPKRIRTPLRFLKEKGFEIVGSVEKHKQHDGLESLKPELHLSILLAQQRRVENKTNLRLPQYRVEMEKRFMKERRSVFESRKGI